MNWTEPLISLGEVEKSSDNRSINTYKSIGFTALWSVNNNQATETVINNTVPTDISLNDTWYLRYLGCYY